MNALVFTIFLISCWFLGIPDKLLYVNHPLKTPFKCMFLGSFPRKGTHFDQNILNLRLSKNRVSGAQSSRTTIVLFVFFLFEIFEKKQQTNLPNLV